MEELLENWQSKMEFYRNEADNATTQINQVKATQKFYTYRDCIKELRQTLILPVVGFTDKKTIDLEEKAFVAGYIKRAKMSNLLIDEITEFHAQRFYKNWQAFKHQP